MRGGGKFKSSSEKREQNDKENGYKTPTFSCFTNKLIAVAICQEGLNVVHDH